MGQEYSKRYFLAQRISKDQIKQQIVYWKEY